MARLQIGDLCQLRFKPPYGKMKLVEIVPKGFEGRRYKIAKVLIDSSATGNFDFALVKYFRFMDLERTPHEQSR